MVREYVEHFDIAWNRSWTSTELMRGLSGEAGWPDPEALGRAMRRAEVAKFAGAVGELVGAEGAAVRTEAEASAERDWRAMRGWVDASGHAPAFARVRDAILAESSGEAPMEGGGHEAVPPAGELGSGSEPGPEGPADIAGDTRAPGGPE